MARIEAEMGADTGADVGGVLVGNAAPSTNFVLVTASLSAPQLAARSAAQPSSELDVIDDPASPSTLTFDAAQLDDLARQVARTYPGQRIVGWYRSHPRSGIFLTDQDLSVQRELFGQPWQVGYVYDPVQGQRGFFGWSGPEIVRVPQWEVTSVAHASGMTLPVSAPVGPDSAAAADSGATSALGRIPVAEPGPFGAPVTGEVRSTKKKRPVGAIIAAVVAVVAIAVVAAIALTGGDDDESATTSTGPENTSVTSAASVPASDADPVDTTATSTSESTTTIADSTTTTTTTTAASDVTTTEPPAITFPATPTAVAAPSARVGDGSVACTAAADGSYAPISDCFVPLNNGNVMVFVAGSLRCVDPDGAVIANEAQQFTIGVDGDPIVLIADDNLNGSCTDLSYATNVLNAGSDTYDGLCGSSGTQINDGTRRCFAHNSTTGSMVALVRSTTEQDDLAASCSTGGTDATETEIEWDDDAVGTAWRIDSIVYQAESNDFLATASRADATSTATITCG